MQLLSGNLNENDRWSKVLKFNKDLSRFYFSYSIIYARAVKEVHKKTYSLNNAICQNKLEATATYLARFLQDNGTQTKVKQRLSGGITYNAKTKYMICRLAAMLEEDYTSKAQIVEDYKTHLEGLLFNPNYKLDIEHIESVNHEDNTKRDEIWETWGSDMNSIGNLIVLERKINRKIKNKSFKDVKRFQYTKKSKFLCVKNIGAMPDWTLEDCQKRKNEQTLTIVNYLFSQN